MPACVAAGACSTCSPDPRSLIPDPVSCRPIVVPHVVAIGPRAGEPRTAARQLLGVSIPLALGVADRQVRHVEIADRPLRRIGRRVIDADAEERDLVAEAPAVGGLDVAGVVPPLDLVVGMARVIAREREVVAGGRLFPRTERPATECESGPTEATSATSASLFIMRQHQLGRASRGIDAGDRRGDRRPRSTPGSGTRPARGTESSSRSSAR